MGVFVWGIDYLQKMQETYNSRDSLVVTNQTTGLLISGLCMAEWTQCSVFLESMIICDRQAANSVIQMRFLTSIYLLVS